jgi:CTD nuclear envelope phosphatase 1
LPAATVSKDASAIRSRPPLLCIHPLTRPSVSIGLSWQGRGASHLPSPLLTTAIESHPEAFLHGEDRRMNSLNILSARVSPPQTPAPSRSNSYGNILSSTTVTDSRRNSRGAIFSTKVDAATDALEADEDDDKLVQEETPLLQKEGTQQLVSDGLGWHIIPKKISFALIGSFRWIFSTLSAPGVYVVACLYDESGAFSPLSQLRKFGALFVGSGRRASIVQDARIPAADSAGIFGIENSGKGAFGRRGSAKATRGVSSNSSSSGMSSESDSDRDRSMNEDERLDSTSSNRHTRSKSLQGSDEIAPARRSIRIKLHNEDNLRQRKHKKAQSTNTQSNGSGAIASGEISPATLKSPTSPAASMLMTKYPRAPAPPRPLIPRRQPSYTIPEAPSPRLTQKTLILDLDETLIHSMAKGGRMSTGHMVEVKLSTLVGAGGGPTLGPQHPILYYVHKRPHCDDFLRRVSIYTSNMSHSDEL